MGANKEITGAVYARDADITYIYRVATMLSYINGKLLLYTEFEITTAAYGKTDSYYDVHDALPVTNTRISFSAGYFF